MTEQRSSMSALAAYCCVALIISGCASGTRAHDEGKRALAKGDRIGALLKLRQAVDKEPTNPSYRADWLREQSAYADELVRRADEALKAGKPDEAATLYAKASAVQPSNERARRGASEIENSERHARMLEDAQQASKEGQLDSARNKASLVLAEDPGNSAARKLLVSIVQQQEKAEDAKSIGSDAQSMLRKPVTLQFRDANIRIVFEALSRTTGLNVVLDRDVKPDLKTTMFVKDASVEDTIDLILLQNQLEKRTLNPTTIFVYPATAAKQKEYQDLRVRTFRVANVDPKYLQNLMKTVLKIKEVSMDERSSTLVLRDTPDALAVAAKLITAVDVADPEVMLEVEVIEVARDRLSNIGLQLPTSFTVATPSSATSLGALRALRAHDLTASSLAATLNFQLEDTDVNILASPRIRARNKEKAKILIGDRIPTITNTVTPVATGVPVITGSVQYQDVGLKLEFEPEVYSAEEVGIKVSLEVSSIAQQFTDAQGGRSYQIGTRNAQTALRLRDGETQILGGLISDQERNTADKVPGLGQLPLLGRLFGNNSGSHNKTELIMAITPHIIRAPVVLDSGARDIFSGTESTLRERPLRLNTMAEVRVGNDHPNPSQGSAKPPAANNPAPGAPTPLTLPIPPAAPGGAPPPLAPPPPAAQTTAATAVANASASAPSATGLIARPSAELAPSPLRANPDLNWSGPAAAIVGGTVRLQLEATSLPAIASLPILVRYDPSALSFVSVDVAGALKQSGTPRPEPKVDTAQGVVEIPLTISKLAGPSNDGPLLTLQFTAGSKAGPTQIIIQPNAVTGADGTSQSIPSGLRIFSLQVVGQ